MLSLQLNQRPSWLLNKAGGAPREAPAPSADGFKPKASHGVGQMQSKMLPSPSSKSRRQIDLQTAAGWVIASVKKEGQDDKGNKTILLEYASGGGPVQKGWVRADSSRIAPLGKHTGQKADSIGQRAGTLKAGAASSSSTPAPQASAALEPEREKSVRFRTQLMEKRGFKIVDSSDADADAEVDADAAVASLVTSQIRPAQSGPLKRRREPDVSTTDSPQVLVRRKVANMHLTTGICSCYTPDVPAADVVLPKRFFQEAVDAIPLQSPSRIELFDFQKKAVLDMADRRGIVLCYDTGNGKTLVAVAASQGFLRACPNATVHVVTPKSLRNQFKASLRKAGIDNHDSYEFHTYQGFASKVQEHERLLQGNMLVCDEAHILRTPVYSTLSSTMRNKIKKYQSTKEQFKDARNAFKKARQQKVSHPARAAEAVGFDIFSLGRQVNVAVTAAAVHASRCMLLTATPIMNRDCDAANLWSVANGEGVLSRKHFNELCKTKQLHKSFYFCPVAPNDPAFPSLKVRDLQLPMTHDFFQEYRAVMDRRHDLLGSTDPFLFYSGLRQATIGLTNSAKVDFVLSIVLQGEKCKQKTLIHSCFITNGVRRVQEKLQQMCVPFAEIDGTMAAEKRVDAVTSYNHDYITATIASNSKIPSDVAKLITQYYCATVNVLFVTQAGGEGLDLKGTRNVVLMERMWNAPSEQQIMGRARRRDSHSHLPVEERKVVVHRLCSVPPENQCSQVKTADQYLEQILKDKEEKARLFAASCDIEAKHRSASPTASTSATAAAASAVTTVTLPKSDVPATLRDRQAYGRFANKHDNAIRIADIQLADGTWAVLFRTGR